MKTKITFLLLLISTTIFAQNGQFSVTELLKAMNTKPNTSHFEVSGEMFKMMAEAEGANAEFKENIGKLTYLKVIRSNSSEKTTELYDSFMREVNLKDYTMLMTTNEANRKMAFYKKEDKNLEKEFLLVSNNIIIYLTGTIDIKSLQEMEGIMNMAGRAVDI